MYSTEHSPTRSALGQGLVIRAGEVQRTSAGTGICQSEFNHSIAYDVTSALLESGALPELSFRQAVEAFGQHGAAELIYLVGLYCLVSVTLNGFDVPVPEPG
jgi:hypothetical protein